MTKTTTPILPCKAYTDGYEQMRCHALVHGTAGNRYGWAMVVRGGVVAWLDAFGEGPGKPPVRPVPMLPAPPSRTNKTEMIDILTTMIRAQLKEVVP